VLHGGPF